MDTKEPSWMKCARQGCEQIIKMALADVPMTMFCSLDCEEAEQKLEQKLVPQKEERLEGDSDRTEETV